MNNCKKNKQPLLLLINSPLDGAQLQCCVCVLPDVVGEDVHCPVDGVHAVGGTAVLSTAETIKQKSLYRTMLSPALCTVQDETSKQCQCVHCVK